ncbi:delta-like protein [Plakobranchus ocellatus]|uniref:Delta-like protein n=1 Tax=Plakobranchus ocellatus TaxID=259542 RepID=A0AAV4DMB8_9GAST|nr:delta-like protein [Plakobranchus ocellatus]
MKTVDGIWLTMLRSNSSHPSGLYFIIPICLVLCFCTSAVSTFGSLEVQVLALELPGDCRCHIGKTSPVSKTSTATGNTFNGLNSSNSSNIKRSKRRYSKENAQSVTFSPKLKMDTDMIDITNSTNKENSTADNSIPTASSTLSSNNISKDTIHNPDIIYEKTSVSSTQATTTTDALNFASLETTANNTNNSSMSCPNREVKITACLAHHQHPVPVDLRCTLGKAVTRFEIPSKMIDISHTIVRLQNTPPLRMPFSYSWPGGFTLRVITAWSCGPHHPKVSLGIVDTIVPSTKWVVFSNEAARDQTRASSEAGYEKDRGNIKKVHDKSETSLLEHSRRKRSNHFKDHADDHPSTKEYRPLHLPFLKYILKNNDYFNYHNSRPPLKAEKNFNLEANSAQDNIHKTDGNPKSPVYFQEAKKPNISLPYFHNHIPNKIFIPSGNTSSSKAKTKRNSFLYRLKYSARRSKRHLSSGEADDNRVLDPWDIRHVSISESSGEQNLVMVATRVVCSSNYYGRNCTSFCRPRDDFLGHYICTPTGQQVCMDGWQGFGCNQAICSHRCLSDRASCPAPNTCVCKHGWLGEHCDRCKTRAGCEHGTCILPGQCICRSGWEGPFCDKKEVFCERYKPCKNGGTCQYHGQHNYTCACPLGYKGAHCEITVCYDHFCLHKGICHVENGTRLCRCKASYTGIRCQHRLNSHGRNMSFPSSLTFPPSAFSLLLSSSTEKTPPSKQLPCADSDSSSRSGPRQKRVENLSWSERNFWNSSCTDQLCEKNKSQEQITSAFSCQTTGCFNEGTCIVSSETEQYHCACPEPYSGTKCEDKNSLDVTTPCTSNPCLNGGLCLNIYFEAQTNKKDTFICQCALDFSGTLCEEYLAFDTGVCSQVTCYNGAIVILKDTSMMVHKDPESRIWLFDSHSRNEDGMPEPDEIGKSILINLKDMADLNLYCAMIIYNILSKYVPPAVFLS